MRQKGMYFIDANHKKNKTNKQQKINECIY